MGLFGRKKRKSLFKKSNKPAEVKLKRKVAGRTSIAETNSPYRQKSFFSNFKRKRNFKKPGSNVVQAPARLRQNKPSRLKRILLIILSLFIIGGSIYFAFFTDFFQVNDFQIFDEGTQITNNLKLNQIITQSLLNQNLLLYNEKQLANDLLTENTEYKTASVKKLFPHTIQIELEKFPISANIINEVDSIDGLKIQKKFLINSNGMIIMENQENAELPYIKITSDKAFQLSDQPINQEKLEYIVKLINLFEEKFGIKVIEAQYLKKAREVHLRTQKDFVVWFDLSKDMLSQIDKLKRSLPKLDIYKTPLEYIDLRISGTNAEKVIYKKR